jgi:hypothetical protein
MSEVELDWKKLDEIWQEKATAAFNEFVEENLKGPTPQKEPACFGSGDGHTACSYCPYSQGC